MQQLFQVYQFHKAFNLQIGNTPQLVDYEAFKLRHKLLEEENQEYLEAACNEDLVGIADALGDQLYIVLGSIITHGMQDVIEEVFDRIHINNMQKLGADGLPIINGQNGVLDESRPLGKVLKPKDWKPVDLTDLI